MINAKRVIDLLENVFGAEYNKPFDFYTLRLNNEIIFVEVEDIYNDAPATAQRIYDFYKRVVQ